ncbi:hypothetical protein M8C21_009912 [Ambrosia artemisiifolia]|uniref:Uncharacterized protein n=1 Tax=Ambrosia artemisiifolia TaxID=4212 RepID=A0AAD5GQM4_AMBAR|nr:hypothetical protein M8C21_009912 [Ambrosia artemisiifolia]
MNPSPTLTPALKSDASSSSQYLTNITANPQRFVDDNTQRIFFWGLFRPMMLG